MAVSTSHVPNAPIDKLVTAYAINNVTAPGGDLYVVVPAASGNRSHVLGWAPKTPLPVKGDACLVAYDENGNPWVVGWTQAEQATPLVTTLPATPYDGQRVFFQNAALALLGVVWVLRYRAASGSSHKWEFLGGAPLAATITTEEVGLAAKTVYGDLATVGPELTVPLVGEYTTQVQARVGAATATGDFYMSFAPNGEAATDGDALKYTSAASYPAVPMARMFTRSLPSGLLVAKYKMSGAGANFSYRTIAITPLRLG